MSLEKYLPGNKMRDLIADNSHLLMVISRFEIPLGFGNATVKEVCEANNVDCSTFLTVANFISDHISTATDINLSSLIVYLRNAHSYFTEFNLPAIRRKLIDAIDCSSGDEVAMLIMKFFDGYAQEVRRHMDYENEVVFKYVDQLLEGERDKNYSIKVFSSKHDNMSLKLRELKDIFIRFYPNSQADKLNSVLFDIINCERDLMSHCEVENCLFVPAVQALEKKTDERENGRESIGTNPVDSREMLENLSIREREIIVCIAKGYSNKEIADELCLSVHTVTTHRRNISTKLSIHTSAGLTIFAIMNNLIDIADISTLK